MTRIKSAVILAAGAGNRFWPYNVIRNKAAFPIANVPAIRRLADSLVSLGITHLVVVIGVHSGSVRAALRHCPAEIIYVEQSQPDGTAQAILLAEPFLEDDFLVVAGDIVTDPQNLAKFIDNFQATEPIAAALIDPLAEEAPQNWIVAFPEGGQLRGVEGHSREGKHRLAGVYGLKLRALDVLRDHRGLMTQVPVGGMPPMEAEVAQSLQDMLDEGEIVQAIETSGYHVDLDKPWHILEANYHVITALSATLDETEQLIPASAQVHDGAEIHGRLILGENTIIGNRVVVQGDLWLGNGASVTNGAILEGSVVIGAKTKVRDYCQIGGHSTLGPLGVYGHGAEFSGVALERVYCYHYCEVWGVVGQAVDFGAATVCGNLRFDDQDTRWRVKGRLETPTFAANAAYFGDFCRTGVNAIIMPGKRIGAYSCVGPGVVAYDDVPDRQVVMLKQELTTQPWGPERYGW